MVMDQDDAKKVKKIWRAGTLTYTTPGIVMLFVWLLGGDFAWSLKERTVGPVVLLLAKSFKLSDFWISVLCVTVPSLIGMFLGPVISFRSDRHRGKYGRRIPFLLMYTPVVVGGLVGLAFTRQLGVWLHATWGNVINERMADIVAFTIFFLMLDVGTALVNALFTSLSNDVVPVVFIGRFVSMFRAVSLVCALIFNFGLLPYAETHTSLIFISLAVLYGVGLFMMCVMVKEGEYPPVQGGEVRRGVIENIRTYFRECFALPYYRYVILAQCFCMLSVLPINTWGMFYAKALGIELKVYGWMLSGGFLVAIFASYYLGNLSDRFHPVRTSLVATAALGCVLFFGGFCVNGKISFCIVYSTHLLFIMSLNSLIASYGQRLFPQSHFAQFASANGSISALLNMAIAMILGWVLDKVQDCFYPDQPGAHYYLLFVIGGVFAFIGVFLLSIVLRYYKSYGGDAHYEAPMIK